MTLFPVSDSMAGQEKIPQRGSRQADPPHFESIPHPSKLSPSKVPTRPRAVSVSSASSRYPSDMGIESNKPVPLLPEHASSSFASQKSILKKRPSSPSSTLSGIPERKSVRFSFYTGD